MKGTKSAGTVYGVKAGTATITATVKAKKGGKTKSFKLTTKVTVKAPSASLTKTTLNVGESTTVKVANAAAKAKITYASDNTAVAAVSGTKVTAVAAGTAKITATVTLPKTAYAKKTTKTLAAGTITVNGETATPAPTATAEPTAAPTATPEATPAATPVATPAATPEAAPSISEKATANTQAELNAALANTTLKEITIGQEATKLEIPAGTYAADLIVDAPKASIVNYGTFKTITIKAVAMDTFTEKGAGNSITVDSPNPVHIIVNTINKLLGIFFKGAASASTAANKVEVKSGTVGSISIATAEKVEVTAETGTKVEAVEVSAAADVDVTASGTAEVTKVEVSGAGADVDVAAKDNAKVGEVSVTAAASGTDTVKTTVDVKTDDSAEVTSVKTAAANSTTNVEANGSSTVGTLKVEGKAEAAISGTSQKTTTVDIKDAEGTANQVKVSTDTVKVEAKAGTDTDNVINNQSGTSLDTQVTNADGTTTEEKTASDGGGSNLPYFPPADTSKKLTQKVADAWKAQSTVEIEANDVYVVSGDTTPITLEKDITIKGTMF